MNTAIIPRRRTPCLHRIGTSLLRLVGTIVLFALFGLAAQAVSAEPQNGLPDTGSGGFWLMPGAGVYIAALRLHTDVDIDVTGPIARTAVRQRFRNTSSLWVEGVYVFPLPDNAAVDRYRLRIGERVIEGQLRERAQARRSYEQAKSEGRRAGLIEQQRPNVFTTSLANIAPGEEITVEFEYQHTLRYEAGIYRLRFPMVVGQRYLAEPDGVPDATGVITEVATRMAGENERVNPASIRVRLDAGVPLERLNSSYHDIEIRQTGEHRYRINTAGSVPSDRDFELTWVPELTTRPRAAVFSQRHNGRDYALVMVYPPDLQALGQVQQPRDVTFVLDISGSMDGASIEQAKAALDDALERLSPDDRFNIVWFNDSAGRLYPDLRYASYDTVQYARQYTGRLQSGGGTEMLPALRLALGDKRDEGRLHQVVFITDGAVNNETALFEYIRSHLGDSRLFTVGIGSAPNAWFMKKAARHGRGSNTFIADLDEVEEKTASLFARLESPALVDIHADVAGIDVQLLPDPVPDLYAGEPLTIHLGASRLDGNVTLRGRYGDSSWQQSISLTASSEHDGVRLAWAREKIASLMEGLHEADSEEKRGSLRAEVVRTSLEHHLLSRYTSMVAVDVTPVNTSGSLVRQKMKTARPHGWKQQTGSGAQVMLAQLHMPQTATGWPLHLLAALSGLAGALAWLARRRR